MNIKKIQLFSILWSTFFITTNFCYTNTTTTPDNQENIILNEVIENFNRPHLSKLQIKLNKFHQAALDCEQAWLKAEEECEKIGNCDICQMFQNLSAKKKMFEAKIDLINETKKLHTKAKKLGINDLLNLQRGFKKIIDF